MKNYHCCATCRNFKAEKKGYSMSYSCTRLGFVTKPNYQFHCWIPREDIKEKIKRS